LPRTGKIDSVRVYWTRDGKKVRSGRLPDFDIFELFGAYPMRDFARRLAQTNHPTAPWLETMGHLIGAESHHEGSFYMLADFHPLIAFIAGQPFTLFWPKGSLLESHTPDCFLATAGGRSGVVVDVKDPRERDSDEWQVREAVVRKILEEMGLSYMVWSGMPRRFRRNLEYLTEARVPVASLDRWSPDVQALASKGITVRRLALSLDSRGYKFHWALTLVRRLLWTHVLETDLMHLVDLETIVWSRL
jgi:hypothetical protein